MGSPNRGSADVGNLAEAVQWFADQIVAAGATCSIDPADADLPGCVVYPATIDFDRLDGSILTLTVDVLLVAGGLRALDALDQIDELIAKVRQAFPTTEFTAISAAIPSKSPDPLPAVRAQLTAQFTITEE